MVDTCFAARAVTLTGHVATVEIQRPPANYFDLALIDALASAYESLEAEPDCRAIVLGSDGEHFCAGAKVGARPRHAPPAGLFPLVQAGGGRGPGRRRRRRGRARPQRGLPRRRAQLVVRVQLRPARHPPGLRHLGHAAPGGRPAAGPGPALHRTPDQGPGGAGGRPGRPAGPDQGPLRATAQSFAPEIAAAAPLAVQAIRRTMRAALAEEVQAAHPIEAKRQRELFGTAAFRRGVDAAA